MDLFRELLEFEWDRGNREKNFVKHNVTNAECEEVFFDPHKRILKEILHAESARPESRYVIVGLTKVDRALYIVFTFRKWKIRVISARDLNRKERGLLP